MKANAFLRILVVALIVATTLPTPVFAQDPEPERPIDLPPAEELGEIEAAAGGFTLQGVDKGVTAAAMAKRLVGEGVSVSNAKFTGSEKSAGLFSSDTGILDFTKGIILSSGSIYTIPGPNTTGGTSTAHGTPGDAQLNQISGYETYDASILEFDFYPKSNFVSFQFVFASEEYNEFVNTRYNDVFGFYINGKNCAIAVGKPITINSINYGNPYGSSPYSNRELFINNDYNLTVKKNISADGLTKTLTCSSSVTANQKNHMKLAIADASDRILDAIVLIKAQSITVEKRPVILIPGIGASFNLACFTRFTSNCGPDDKEWGWTPFSPAESTYANLISRLTKAGYTTANNYLNIFYYDWRDPVHYNGERLMERIKKIKAATHSDSVDIIGHSMGGLVARAYIQGNNYKNDVAHLVTLGTPHKGSAKSYITWEGMLIDKDIAPAASAFLIWYQLTSGLTPGLQTFRKFFPSFKDLLPTEDYLLDESTNTLKPVSSMRQQNNYVDGLNQQIASKLLPRTDVTSIRGTGYHTIRYFYVNPPSAADAPLWEDGNPGNPVSFSMINTGDGTVLESSSLLPEATNQVFSLTTGEPADHGGLVGNNQVINYVFTELDISVASTPSYLAQTPSLMMYVFGDVEATITNPQGLTSSPYLAIEDTAEVQSMNAASGDMKVFVFENPPSGQYNIEITGTGYRKYAVGVYRGDAFDTQEYVYLPDLIDATFSRTTAYTHDVYKMDFSGVSDLSLHIEAPRPIISAPLKLGWTSISVKTVSSASVQIFDQTTGQVIGAGSADIDGNLVVEVPPLINGHILYAVANSVQGDSVLVDDYRIYFPLTKDLE